jgi:Ca2+-binding RTX toxin-like protein
LVVQGNYPGLLLGSVAAVEVLLIASGSDTRFGDTAGNSYDYSVATSDGNVAAGGVLTVMATGLQPGEDLVFNGSAESDGGFRIFAGRGTDTLTGGGGSDGFFFGADGNLTAADAVNGGGGIDTLALRGHYGGAGAVVFQNGSFTGIEVVALLSGLTNEYGGPIAAGGYDYDLTLADGNVAAGQRLDINGARLAASESVRLDARAESDGSVRILSGAGDDSLFGSANADILYGGLGADAIDGGGGADLYLYRSVFESTSAARDTLAFTAGDRIDLSFIDANTTTPGINDAFTFIGSDAFSAAGQLRAFQSGGQWIVEGDVNGDGVTDLVITVTGAATIAAGDFVP